MEAWLQKAIDEWQEEKGKMQSVSFFDILLKTEVPERRLNELAEGTGGTDPEDSSSPADAAAPAVAVEKASNTSNKPASKSTASSVDELILYTLTHLISDDLFTQLEVRVSQGEISLAKYENSSETRQQFLNRIDQAKMVPLELDISDKDNDLSMNQNRFSAYNGDVEKWTQVFRARFVPIDVTERLNQLLYEFHVDLESQQQTYDPTLVNIKGNIPHQLMFPPNQKSVVPVIAGESGSGKTLCALFGILPEVPRIYLTLESSKTRYLSTMDDKEKQKYALFQKALQELADGLLRPSNPINTNLRNKVDFARSTLYQALRRFQVRRNNEAKTILENMIKQNVSRDPDLITWFLGNKAPLDNLIIVIDEGGKDLDFCRAVIDIHREYTGSLVRRRVANKINIVLSGTSLDSLQQDGTPELAAGTDPSKSQVYMMGNVNVDSLQQYAKYIKGPMYSSVLATNARMLMHGVFPIISMYFWKDVGNSAHEYDEADETERFEFICGQRLVMDYAVRIYYSLNGLTNLSPTLRRSAFEDSFKYVLAHSVNSVDAGASGRRCPLIRDAIHSNERWKFGKTDIFTLGIMTVNPADSSRAMKLLACRGMAQDVSPGNGGDFEGAVSLHTRRLLEVLGRCVVQYTLTTDWPPPAPKNNPGPWTDALDERQAADLAKLAKMISAGTRPFSIVIDQPSESTAQGPDHFILDCLDDNKQKNLLHVIQDKNYTKTDLSAVDAADSLGLFGLTRTERTLIYPKAHPKIDFGKALDDASELSELKARLKLQKGIADGGPTRQEKRLDKSIRSRKAILRFADNLATEVRKSNELAAGIDKLGHPKEFSDIVVGSRIVAVNKDHADVSTQDKIVAGLTVWSREFLEPTIGMFTKSQAKVAAVSKRRR